MQPFGYCRFLTVIMGWGDNHQPAGLPTLDWVCEIQLATITVTHFLLS